ncbi:MAG: hypothetical protein ACPG6B_01945 [Oceanihabitans sp.]
MQSVFLFSSSTIYMAVELLFVPFITLGYLLLPNKKSTLFTLFLVVYSISDILNLFDGETFTESLYFICNSLYVLAYIFLFFSILFSMDLRKVFKKFYFQCIVLTGLSIYLFIVLFNIVNPVTFESDIVALVQFVEHMYNLVLLFILVVSFLSYLEKETSKSLLLFLACLSLIFSEFLLIGYYYLLEMDVLSYIATMLNFLAFMLFFYQAKLKPESKKKVSYI